MEEIKNTQDHAALAEEVVKKTESMEIIWEKSCNRYFGYDHRGNRYTFTKDGQLIFVWGDRTSFWVYGLNGYGIADAIRDQLAAGSAKSIFSIISK